MSAANVKNAGIGLAGFSLVEMMVALSIAAILLGAGVPGFRTLIHSQQITSATNDLFAAVNLARSEAIHRGTRVDLVPAGGTDWSRGWVVFIDGNGNQTPDAGEKVIFSHGPVPDGITVRAKFTDSSRQYLAYTAVGRTRVNAGSHTPQMGSFSIALDEQVREIRINLLGRPRVCNPAIRLSSC